MSIESDLKDVVANYLPQAVGAELQQLLEEAANDKAELKAAKESIKLKDADAARLRQELQDERVKIYRAGDLDAREKAVAERERQAEINELKVRLACADHNTQFARDVAMGLVRNVEYRSSVMERVENKSFAIPGSGANAGFVGQAYQPQVTSVSNSSVAA